MLHPERTRSEVEGQVLCGAERTVEGQSGMFGLDISDMEQLRGTAWPCSGPREQGEKKNSMHFGTGTGQLLRDWEGGGNLATLYPFTSIEF